MSTAPRVGDVVRIRKATYSGRIEVDYVDDTIVAGRIPYATTYTEGGQYEGSYRGRQSAWLTEVESIERRADDAPQSPPESVNDVRCPRCRAAAGNGCQTPSGHPANEPHMARVNAYWDAVRRYKGSGPHSLTEADPS